MDDSRLRRTLTLLLLASVLVPTSSLGQQGEARRVRFDYEVGPGTSGCPNEAAMRAAVRARLGYDPFSVSFASHVLVARIGRGKGRRLLGRIQLRDDIAATASQERRFRARVDSCAELASTMALGIAIALEPFGEPAPLRLPRRPQALVPESVGLTRLDRLEPPPEISVTPWRLHFSVGLTGALGLAPGFASGGGGQIGLYRTPWSIDVGFEYLSPVARDVRGGQIEVSSILGSVVPCWRTGAFRACVVLRSGVSHGEGASTVNQPLLNVGARAALVVPMSQAVTARLAVDVGVNTLRTTFRANGSEIWGHEWVTLGLGASLVVSP